MISLCATDAGPHHLLEALRTGFDYDPPETGLQAIYLSLFVLLLILILRLNRRGSYRTSHILCLLASIATTAIYLVLILSHQESWEDLCSSINRLLNQIRQ